MEKKYLEGAILFILTKDKSLLPAYDKLRKTAGKVLERINELATCSEDKTCLTRTYASPAFLKASDLVMLWMKEAGLETWKDNIGNVRGRLMCPDVLAKTFVIASHIDTVINAGKFDGPLGVVLAIELAGDLKTKQAALPFHVEIIAFCDEEGVRFHSTFLGSKVVAGQAEPELFDRKDEIKFSVSDYIHRMGGRRDKLQGDAIPPGKWLGYFEIHIEQGPVLYEKNLPVALVTGIAGQKRAELIFTGIAGHAGTVPMHMRNDALCAAAEVLIEVERFALVHAKKLVATVGKLNVLHAAGNVIPGNVTCSLDVRSTDQVFLQESYDAIQHIGETICRRRRIHFLCNLAQETLPVKCDDRLNRHLAKAIEEAGFPLVQLASGAGHDAVPISAVAPVAMLFVKCFKGISHNPLEDVEVKDIAAALKTSRIFIDRLIRSQTNGQS